VSILIKNLHVMRVIKILPIFIFIIGAFFFFSEESIAEDECGEQCNILCYATAPDACSNTLCWNGEEYVTQTCYGDKREDPVEG